MRRRRLFRPHRPLGEDGLPMPLQEEIAEGRALAAFLSCPTHERYERHRVAWWRLTNLTGYPPGTRCAECYVPRSVRKPGDPCACCGSTERLTEWSLPEGYPPQQTIETKRQLDLFNLAA